MSNVNTSSVSNQQGSNKVVSKPVIADKKALRAARIAAVQAKMLQIAHAARAAAMHARKIAIQQTKQQSYMLAVQQLAAQYGVAPVTQQVRSVAGAQKHAPSAQSGACKKVHEIAAANNYNRAATLAACVAEGINPATAATQFAIAKRKSMQ